MLVRTAELSSAPIPARHVGMGAWVEVRKDGSNGGAVLPMYRKPLDAL
jgi:hypothetical protein